MSYIHMEHLFLMFLYHTQWRSTVGRTPLDEWSARHRDFYLTTRDTHNRQISMPPVGFEPKISASEWPQSAHLLRLLVRIPPGAWIFVCCECHVLSGRSLCDELITRPEESYRLCCVVVCDVETSRIGAPYIYIYDISNLRVKMQGTPLNKTEMLVKKKFDCHKCSWFKLTYQQWQFWMTYDMTRQKGSKASCLLGLDVEKNDYNNQNMSIIVQ
jgi:hypothetical protein